MNRSYKRVVDILDPWIIHEYMKNSVSHGLCYYFKKDSHIVQVGERFKSSWFGIWKTGDSRGWNMIESYKSDTRNGITIMF